MPSSLPLKNQPKKGKFKSEPNRFILKIIRSIVSIYRGYLKLHIWSMVVALIIVVLIGELLTRSGWLLVIMILVYISLYFLDKWLEKNDEK